MCAHARARAHTHTHKLCKGNNEPTTNGVLDRVLCGLNGVQCHIFCTTCFCWLSHFFGGRVFFFGGVLWAFCHHWIWGILQQFLHSEGYTDVGLTEAAAMHTIKSRLPGNTSGNTTKQASWRSSVSLARARVWALGPTNTVHTLVPAVSYPVRHHRENKRPCGSPPPHDEMLCYSTLLAVAEKQCLLAGCAVQ